MYDTISDYAECNFQLAFQCRAFLTIIKTTFYLQDNIANIPEGSFSLAELWLVKIPLINQVHFDMSW